MMFERMDWLIQKPDDHRLDLSNNVCYDVVLQNQVSFLMSRQNVQLHQYADEGRIYDVLSEYYGIHPRQIAVGFGLGELIPRIFRLYRDRKFSIVTPTWMMATGICEVEGIDYVEGIDTSADVLYIANPNGMSGQCLYTEELYEYLNKFELIIVDEAYGEFSTLDATMIDQAVAGNNVIVCKSLSKSLALPGLRFGYCFSHPELIKRIQDVRPSGSINTIISELGLDLFNLMNDHIERMIETRNYIEETYDCVPSQANFVLFKNPEPFLEYVKYRKIGNLHRMSLTDRNTFRYYEEISKF